LLWIGQFVSQMGDRLAMVAFPWLVYEATGSALSTGAIFALYTVPYVLFGTLAGVAIDRFNKRSLMIVADIVRAALVVFVPVAAQWSLPLVYLLSFLMASAAVVFDPCKLALLPDIVPESRLLRANSLLAIGENLTEIIGYTFAGFTLAFLSIDNALRMDSVSFLVSALALLFMRYQAPVASAANQAISSIRDEIGEGLGYLLHHRGLLVNTIIVVAFVAGLGASYPLTFLFAVETLDGGTESFGILEAVMALGYLAGSVALATVANRVRKGRTMVLGLLAMGMCLMLVSMTKTTWQACVPFALFGVANAAALIAVDTYLQQVVPERLRGRVFGVRFTLTQGTWAASVFAGGALASLVDVRLLFVLAGSIMVGAAASGLLVRDLREA
jgi:MFS family permease